MLTSEPVALTLAQDGAGAVTLQALRTTVRLPLGSGAVFADYTRPIGVTDDRGETAVQHRIIDFGSVLWPMILVLALLVVRSLRRTR